MLTVYRASAGSGKTFRLTGDYIRLLFREDPEFHPHRSILAVTFTNKATDEMKSRIILELHKLATNQPSPYLNELTQLYSQSTEEQIRVRAGKILNAILHDYSAFSISTIDKFFQQVIRAFAREIGVHGGYALELEQTPILEQAVDNMFVDLSAGENKQLLDWLTAYAEEKIEASENWNMRSEILNMGNQLFAESYQAQAQAVHEKLHDRNFLRGFRSELNTIINDFNNDLKRISTQALKIIDDAGLKLENFKGGSRSSINLIEKLSTSVIDDPTPGATFRLMAEAVEECYTKSAPADIVGAITRIYTNGLQSLMQELIQRVDTGIIYVTTARLIKKHLNTLGILSDLSVQVKKLTNEQNTMLIADSNLLLNKVIDNSDAPFIYEKTGLRIHHFMIDEFQDTSVMQWQNFLPLISNSLAAGDDNLVVGDVKQSIYRWRNSDWKLLDRQIYTDFTPDQLNNESLSTNYRSDRHIVEFNNAIFSRMAAYMQQLLNTNVEPLLSELPELGPLTTSITKAYNDVGQQTKPDAGEGLVRFSFIDKNEGDESWKELSLQQLPKLVENLQQRGYKPSDIAILVRSNNDAQLVIEKLLHYKTQPEALADCSYDIIGNEGLFISSAPSVRFLTALLHLFVYPDDTVQQTIVTYEYGRGKLRLSDNEALAAYFSKSTDGLLCPHFTPEENDELLKLRQLSLFEICEQLIYRYQLADWHGEAIFLQAFQDVIFNYSKGKSADLNSFLQWWDEHGINKTIPMPENDRAMRIMTIHKSKGLDFKVVIMPFCDWDFVGRQKPLLWCSTDKEPFAQLPLLPVEFSSKLGQSVFANQYYSELMHTYIDNLNVAYVAFTRARNEMHCFCKQPRPTAKGIITVNSLSSLLYTLLKEKADGEGTFDEATQTYCAGVEREFLNEKEVEQVISKEKEPVVTTKLTTNEEFAPTDNNQDVLKQQEPLSSDGQSTSKAYPVELLNNRLRIRHRIHNFNREETDITDNPIDYGNLMHEIFSELKQPGEYQHLVDRLIQQGRITAFESKSIVDDLEAFGRLPEVNLWFDSQAKALNETTIITPTGALYRPDRVVLNGNHATVVDYKFGAAEHLAHIRQVENYAGLLREMGYSCSGYLCYVKLKKVVTVS